MTNHTIRSLTKPWRTPSRSHANSSDHTQSELDRLEQFAHWLDTAFEVPGTRFRFGLDPILGLIPGFGDFVGLVAAVYLLSVAQRFGLPKVTVVRMMLNVGIDMVVGSIPLVGDLFDAAWKVNKRNLEIVKRHLRENQSPGRRRARRSDQIFAAGAVILLILGFVASMALMYWLVVSLAGLLLPS